VYVVVAVSTPVDAVPLVGSPPVQPPDAVQLAAFVELHVSVDESPVVIVCGFALSETVGSGMIVTDAV
jgi:hypothetical protein